MSAYILCLFRMSSSALSQSDMASPGLLDFIRSMNNSKALVCILEKLSWTAEPLSFFEAAFLFFGADSPVVFFGGISDPPPWFDSYD